MSVTAESAVHAPQEIRTPWTEFWRKFKKQPVALAAGVFVLLLIVIAIIAAPILMLGDNFMRGGSSGRRARTRRRRAC
jgi:hypothetical protein